MTEKSVFSWRNLHEEIMLFTAPQRGFLPRADCGDGRLPRTSTIVVLTIQYSRIHSLSSTTSSRQFGLYGGLLSESDETAQWELAG